MEWMLYDRLTDELYLKQLRELLILGDEEFIPPLSARSSTTQQELATASDGGIDAYFEEMKTQSFVLALEGERLAGFMSFRKNHTGPHIPEAKNLYASTCVVHPDFRGQGLMTSFYREMIRAYPALPIFTRTWHQNAGHLKVLDKLGFRLLETVENDRGEGIHTVYYGRTSDLNPPLTPAFGETDYHEDRISDTVRVLVLHGVSEDSLGRYCALLEKDGCVKKESDEKESYQYAAYEKDDCGYFLNYFPTLRELTLVRERDSAYFSYEDRMLEPLYTPTVTQIALKDFGMSYVIRLSDGRLILFDGGREFDEDVEHLWNSIRAISPFEKPVIAAWILSHAHSDHFHCCHHFMARYGDEVEVEKFFLNFPEYDDEAHFAEMIKETPTSPRVNVPLLWEQIRRSKAKVYTPHSGQSYTVGDAQILFFAAMDETIHCAKKINASSLVFRMRLGGQTILWTSDVSSSVSRLPERYGNELRADILQVPHHGFRCGTDKAEIALYNFAKAETLLLPASEETAYQNFSAFRKGTHFGITAPWVKEVIVGTPERTIALPYTPEDKREDTLRKIREGRRSAGATTWIFSGLSTGRPEDLSFTVLNTTYVAASIRVQLYFDTLSAKRSWKTDSTRVSLCTLSLSEEAVAIGEKELPENATFSVRFHSDLPIVITNEHHKADYFALEEC